MLSALLLPAFRSELRNRKFNIRRKGSSISPHSPLLASAFHLKLKNQNFNLQRRGSTICLPSTLLLSSFHRWISRIEKPSFCLVSTSLFRFHLLPFPCGLQGLEMLNHRHYDPTTRILASKDVRKMHCKNTSHK